MRSVRGSSLAAVLLLSTAASAATAPRAMRTEPREAADHVYRAGLHLGRLAAGRAVSRPWAVTKLVTKTGSGALLIGAGLVGWGLTATQLASSGHEGLALMSLLAVGIAHTDPFLPMPGSSLAILGMRFAEGWQQGRHSEQRSAFSDPAIRSPR